LILGSVAYNNRQPQEELKLMERLVEVHPRDARAHNELGNSLYWQKNWPAAIKEYLKAVELAPSFSQPYNGLGYCYRFTGDLVMAEAFFLKYLQMLPDDPNPYDSYADLLSEMGRHEEAITFYRKAIEIRPDFISSNLGIAWNYCVLGEYPKAIDQLTRLFELSPDDARRRRALLGIAAAHVDAGDFEQARNSLELSCEIAQTSPDPLALADDSYRLGLVLLEAGRPDDASRAFSASLQAIQDISGSPRTVLEKAELDHMRGAALVWLTRGDLTNSTDLARRFMDLAVNGSDPARVRQAHQTLGLVELASGNLSRAIDELSQSDLSEAYTQYHLARAYEASGDIGQALKYYRLASTYDQFNSFTQSFVRKRAKQGVESLLLARQVLSTSTTPAGTLP